MNKSKPQTPFGGSFAFTVVLILFALVGPLPALLRALIVLGVVIGWSLAGIRWSIHRYGKKAAIAIVLVTLTICGFFGTEYWLDLPNRQLMAKIEAITGFSAVTRGGLFVGKVYWVRVGSGASDDGFSRFIELDGLTDLTYIHLDGAKVNDELVRKLARITSLTKICFQNTGVSPEVVDDLRRILPNCEIEILGNGA